MDSARAHEGMILIEDVLKACCSSEPHERQQRFTMCDGGMMKATYLPCSSEPCGVFSLILHAIRLLIHFPQLKKRI
jgi:hypothetical protein